MNIRHFLPTALLVLGSAYLIGLTPKDDLTAQETKAEKKAARLKKRMEEAKKPEEAKPEVKVEPKIEKKAGNPTDAKEVAQAIDREIDKLLREAKIASSVRTGDAEFIRRASLDITGVIPSPERVQAFLDGKEADKRDKLILEFLADAKYGQRMTDLWIWQMFPNDSDNRAVPREPLTDWLKDSFNANLAWNQMVRNLLTADGQQQKHGEVTYFLANRGVDKITDSVGKLFLGVQIQCAQCHNHPFSDWKQTEYWGLAQFFYKVDARAPRNANKQDVIPEVEETSRPNRRMNPLPDSAKTVQAKFLGGESPKLNSSKPYRPVLADWLTADDNPFFAKAMVNRIWAQYFGRGLVNPIDDLRPENAPTHPELFEALTKEFVKSGYDVKHLIHCICLTEAYQRSSIPTAENKLDDRFYSHQAIKVLTGEQLFDSLERVVGGFNGRVAPKGKDGRQGLSPRDRFAQFFMGTENAKSTDYEAGIPQALRIMNNPKINNAPGLIGETTRVGVTPNGIIEKLYLMVLSRRPTAEETRKMVEYVAKESDSKTAYGDILWALLNSSEFALNR